MENIQACDLNVDIEEHNSKDAISINDPNEDRTNPGNESRIIQSSSELSNNSQIVQMLEIKVKIGYSSNKKCLVCKTSKNKMVVISKYI